jgi:hypothetical protein
MPTSSAANCNFDARRIVVIVGTPPATQRRSFAVEIDDLRSRTRLSVWWVPRADKRATARTAS